MSFELVAAEGVEEHEWKRAYNLRKCNGENVTVTKRNSADEDVSFTRFEPHDFISNDEVRHPAYYIEKGNSRQCVNAESVKGIVSMVQERTRRYGTEAWRGPWGGEIKGAVPSEFDNPDLALIKKACNGPVWLVQLLLHLGANPNTRSSDEHYPKGSTPLVEAIKGSLYNSYYSETKVSLLLQNGADVEFTDGKGVTPLMAAVNGGNENIVRTLLDHGADPKKTVGKLAPLSLAAKKGHYRVVKVLLEKGAEVEEKTGGQTPLLHAVREGEHAAVRTLLDAGEANANATTMYGLTPLIIAAKKGLYSIAQTLLSKGADVDGTDKDGMTPLMYAVKHGHADVVRMLLDEGADVKKKDVLRERERSWLDNRTDVYEYTRVHHRDGNFGTAFMYAARYWNGDRTIVDTLLEKGSDVNEENERDKKTPLSLAAMYGDVELIQILLDKGANIKTADQANIPLLGYAAVGKDENIVRELLNRGADVTKKGAGGATPLMHAMTRPDHAITRLLLENGADVNDKDAKWFSPLTVAVGTWPYADQKTLQTLLDNGANVLAKDVHGRTALMHVVQRYESDLTAALTMLEFEMNKNGSNVSELVNVQDGKFKTALDYCPTYEREMRRLLLDFGAEEGGIRKSDRTRGNDVEHSELPDDHQEDEWEDGFDNEELFAVTSSETAEEARLTYDEFLTDLGIELGIEPGRKELRKLIKKKNNNDEIT